MYSFVRAEPFHGLSSLYEIYDSNNTYVTTMVVGYDDMNNIYFFTEYKGASRVESIDYTDEFCAILSDFSILFEMLEPTDIISDNYRYLTYRDEMPEISLKYLYLYDSSGEVSHERDGDWIVIPNDNILEDLVYCKAINGTQILLEDYSDDYNDGDSLFVDLSEDVFICDGDELEGYFLAINDWNEIARRAESYKTHSC
jgi:hypothetical protein